MSKALPIALMILVLGCSSDPAPLPAGTIALHESTCLLNSECQDNGVCLEVLGATYCALPCTGTTCDNGQCQPSETADLGCRPTCSVETPECPGELVCIHRGDHSICARADAPDVNACGSGYQRCDGTCVQVSNNLDHCGECGSSCPTGASCQSGSCECSEGQIACGGACIFTATDPLNCGGCDHSCDYDHAESTCVSGKCVLLGCSEGYVNCDEQDENGCEAAIEDVPTPIITLNEDSEAGPMANFSLSGSESISPAGNIQTYSWTLIQPVGSHVTLQPNDMSENVSFVGNVVGSYSVTLSISDDQGLNSCTPASQTMTVLPSELLHIELSWDTAGLNLDLHLAHAELAINGEDVDGDEVPDPWFDEQFDCWAGNPNPIWGDPNNTKDDPTLHREDSDGWGPELLGMSVPEADTEYRLAVHMPEEEGATPAQASIRVYLWDDLVFERANVSLNPGDLWDVGTLDATQKAFTANLLTGGERVIIPDYPIP